MKSDRYPKLLGDIAENADQYASQRLRPHLAPDTTIGDGKIPPQARLDDVVSAVKVGALGSQLGLIMRREYGIEYTVPVVVPEALQQKLLFDIVRRKNITLREVGELRIS